MKPDRDVRPFQDVILDLGAQLKFPGLIKKDGQKRYPGGYPDYLANHERLPGVGMLAGFRGEDGSQAGEALTLTRLMLISTMIVSGFRSWPMIKSIINM